MSSVYILMKQPHSPVVFNIPTPYRVYARKKDAHEACERMNARSRTLTYWVSKVEFRGWGEA